VTRSLELRIRHAAPADRAWLLPLVPRLHEFGPPPWREVRHMNAAVAEGLAAALEAPAEGTALLVAEQAADAAPLGFVHVVTAADYFTREPHGHVSDLVVARAGEGRGVGRALLAAAERWALARGYRLLTLNVFVGNDRARALYERCGYVPEWTKMVKELRASRRARGRE
jgi:GNAT superfamily N-acetyltransferase